MGALRRLFWIVLLLGAAAGGLGAIVYLKAASDLPELQTDTQVVGLVGRSVEAYRSAAAHASGRDEVAPFATIDRELLRSPAAGALLAAEGCPGYLDVPAPAAAEFWRAAIAGGGGPAGCAVSMAEDLARRLPLDGNLQLLIAANRIQSLLGRDGLFALWLSALPFDPDGPQGIVAASEKLFRVAPSALGTGRAAELAVATSRYDEFAICKNPPQLHALRDQFLAQEAALLPARKSDFEAAAKRPLACERPPPAR